MFDGLPAFITTPFYDLSLTPVSLLIKFATLEFATYILGSLPIVQSLHLWRGTLKRRRNIYKKEHFLLEGLRNYFQWLIESNGRNTLDDTSLQHVAAANHPLCTGRATSLCNKLRNTLRRQITTNPWLRNKICHRNTSHKFNLIWFFVTCCGDKDFHKSSYSKRFLDATCRPGPTGCCNLSPSVFRT